MNKNFLVEQIKKREAFEKAYLYAIAYRINQDSYCNFIEIDYYRQNKEKLFESIQAVFNDPQLYEAETAFSLYLPKSDMFFRRMIHTPFKDLVIKFIFVTVLAELLDFTFIKNCFSYRLKRYSDKDKKSKEFLYQYYYDRYQEFVNWQWNQVEENICMLKTDISSFYDSISHEYLLSALSKQIDLEKDSIFITLFSKTLKFKICYY
jgi:retron-type reverse transcriptase